ncbi:MAG: 1-acyl-sn-glycerol-3-phosphate acyltransferase [Desulfobacterales bacterium]
MKFRELINKALNGTHNHYSCFLSGKSAWFSTALLKLFYSGIKFENDQFNVVKNIPPDAILVYLNKHKSKFEYIFFHTRYKQKRLPHPQIGFDYRVFIWQRVSRMFKIILANVDFFFQSFSLPDPYSSGYIKKQLLSGCPAFLSLVEKGGFYRRFVKSKMDPIRYLIEIQKTIDRPIFIVPHLMFFSKDPIRSNPTLIDILFGVEDRPGILRRLITLIKKPGKVFVEVSEPLNLKQFLEQQDISKQSAAQQTTTIRRHLLRQLNRHRQSITGPVLKSREELKESILTNQRFFEFMENYSKSREIPMPEVRKKADAYIDEIAANYSSGLIKVASLFVGWILKTMFDGVTVNHEEVNRIKAMSQKGPLILVPSHKSHIDYLLLSYLLYHHNMPCPHIAAGKNLAFWPLGPLFRKGGAFFIRRSFRGAVLYSKVFTEYIYKLLEEGFNIEFFIEGGRSRTGKLILPKLGLLSILLDAYKAGVCQDMIFVPIYIGYDWVLEESSYVHELEGGQKKPENFWQVLNARRFLKKRYGKIYVQFHEALSLNDILQQQGCRLAEMKSKEKNAFCRNLGHRIINSINKQTVITPHGLVASALLNFTKKRFSYEHLKSQVCTYLKYLNAQGAALSDTLIIDQDYAIRNAFETCMQRKFIEPVPQAKENPVPETKYKIIENRRPTLEYYKNNCVSFFIPAAFTALEILNKDAFQFSGTDLHRGYAFLQELFKNEFAYDSELTPEYYVRKSLKSFIDDAIIIPHQTLPDTYNVTSAGFRKLTLYSRFLKTYFESYWVVLSFFMHHHQNSLEPKERLKKIEIRGNRMHKRNEIERKEALSKVTYQNAVDFFISRGIKGAEDTEKFAIYDEAINRYLNRLQN